ncbi:hypothetical protein EYF80_029480 [Liparis tanakae]|uniref:Uncharacterized protein n=1 Tax=Liparis tanakae TaxID=230148 RepID=A0A4Z2H4V4_9TELE|nr:hypothetical protein EYF80_029480 [Liparis tanakae]
MYGLIQLVFSCGVTGFTTQEFKCKRERERDQGQTHIRPQCVIHTPVTATLRPEMEDLNPVAF